MHYYKTTDGKHIIESEVELIDDRLDPADAYCARSAGQKQTMKVKARRKAWDC